MTKEQALTTIEKVGTLSQIKQREDLLKGLNSLANFVRLSDETPELEARRERLRLAYVLVEKKDKRIAELEVAYKALLDSNDPD